MQQGLTINEVILLQCIKFTWLWSFSMETSYNGNSLPYLCNRNPFRDVYPYEKSYMQRVYHIA